MKAVVFDLDGTILNTTRDIGLALGKAFSTVFSDEQVNRFVGRGLRNAVKAAAKELGYEEEDVDELLQRLLKAYRDNPVQYTRPYPGVESLLSDLSNAGVPLCVYSNKEQDLTETIIRICFPTIKFAQITGMHGKYEPKPSYQAIEAFSKLVKIPFDQILYIGDSEVDFKTAVNANLEYRILITGMRTKENLLETGVPEEALISEIGQVRDLIL